MTTGRINQVSINQKSNVVHGSVLCEKSCSILLQWLCFLLTDKQNPPQQDTNTESPQETSPCTHTFLSIIQIQSFPLGTFKQPALTSDQTPAQHGNSFLSPLFLSTILPDYTKSNSVCTHCRIMVSSTGNSFMYSQQHAQEDTSHKPHKVPCQLSFPRQPN